MRSAQHVSFWIAGPPKAQPRVKATRRGSHARVFTPGTADAWKAQVALACPDGFHAPAGHPVKLVLAFSFEHPKSHYGTGRNRGQLKARFARARHVQVPDFDNLAKAVVDALKGRLWADDCQIVDATISKQWGRQGGVQIMAEIIKEEEQ